MKSRVKVAALAVTSCLLLLAGFNVDEFAHGAQPSLSGSLVSSFVDNSFGQNVGNGTYTVSYDFPLTINLGSNLTGRVSLQVNQLNGLQLYVEVYQITVQLATPTGQGSSGTVSGSAPLYPGAIWGPNNVTVPITQEKMGQISQPINASVTITLGTTVLAQLHTQGGPSVAERAHVDSQLVGNVTVEAPTVGNSGSGASQSQQRFIPYVIVGAGAVVVAIGVLLPKIFPERSQQEK